MRDLPMLSSGSSGNKRKRRILPLGVTLHKFSSLEPEHDVISWLLNVIFKNYFHVLQCPTCIIEVTIRREVDAKPEEVTASGHLQAAPLPSMSALASHLLAKTSCSRFLPKHNVRLCRMHCHQAQIRYCGLLIREHRTADILHHKSQPASTPVPRTHL